MKKDRYRAAGGVVLDATQRVLLIERDVVRDGRTVHEVRLPKGHVEKGEADPQAAVREVTEETGYCDLRITADLGEAQTEFDRAGRHVVRNEHYFLMMLRSPAEQPRTLDPEKEESLFVLLWAADLDEAEAQLTYESEQQFIRRARTALEQLIDDA